MQSTKVALLLALLVPTLLKPELASACKARFYPEKFPLSEVRAYEHIYVVRVDSITFSEPLGSGRYAPPFYFEGTILKSLKGPMKPRQKINAATSSNEAAEARCPVFLEVGKVYLLMFEGSNDDPYILPRYGSLFTSSEEPEFNRYVSDVTYFLKRQKTKRAHKPQ